MSDLEVMATPRASGRVPLAIAWAGALFLVITVTLGVDLADDLFSGGVGRLHVVGESLAFALAILGAVGTTIQIRKILARTEELSRDVLRVQAELDRWRAEAKPAMGGLRAAIGKQFDRWTFTPAEREIALLILNGLSHKEIAERRATTERTVRQQSLAIYRKAGLAGRAELSAFFLNDLLLPDESVEPARSPATSEPDTGS